MPIEQEPSKQAHFLVVTYPAQGHINPARHLANRLAQSTGARVTFSTAISAHRKMFPLSNGQEFSNGTAVSYVPFSDGYPDGFNKDVDDSDHYMEQVKLFGSKTVSAILGRLKEEGRPVTCVVYTLLLSWVADVAREHGVPSALYWIQPATVLATYYHYFHGHEKAITALAHDPWAVVSLPGLPPLKIRDLPSFLTITSNNDPYASVLTAFREVFETLDRESENGKTKPSILVNTFDEIEPEQLKSIESFNAIAIGPVLSFLNSETKAGSSSSNSANDLFKQDDKGYLEWLDAQPAKSVVYVSFGSLLVMNKRQIAEIAQGIRESGKPFLWVLRQDNRNGQEIDRVLESLGDMNGMVVEWCNQVKVLSHPSLGCFVTHCGWNSTLESIACGVPTIGVPEWTDQGTNAWLMEKLGTGIRVKVSAEDGVVEASELKRCLEYVMTDTVRKTAEMWKEKAHEAVGENGSSERNLRAFVKGISEDH